MSYGTYRSLHSLDMVKAHRLSYTYSNLIEVDKFFQQPFAIQIIDEVEWWNVLFPDWTYNLWATYGDWIVKWEDGHITVYPDGAFTRTFQKVITEREAA